MDFTLDQYQRLLTALQQSGLKFHLRHDVDKKPQNSLRTAQMEAAVGISATYYFRTVPESFDEGIIKAIAQLGHEIGYHYESLTTCRGDLTAAYGDFCSNLERLRRLSPITSICMHGSPRSPWDSRDLWKKYDYRSLGVTFEPYLDTDFSKTLYLTDTGRRWDGYRMSVRDKIPHFQEQWDAAGLSFRHTQQIVQQLDDPSSPLRQSKLSLAITTHPQRWNPFGVTFLIEWAAQNCKNAVKRILIHIRKSSSPTKSQLPAKS